MNNYIQKIKINDTVPYKNCPFRVVEDKALEAVMKF